MRPATNPFRVFSRIVHSLFRVFSRIVHSLKARYVRFKRFYVAYIRKGKWGDIQENFSENWKNRISLMASLIPDDAESVLDIGCGKMWLRDFLKSSVTYYGLDYTKRDEHTIVCDLNNREFPAIKVDAVFRSGVIEYINEDNLNWFMEKLSEISDVLIVSYCTLEYVNSMHTRKMNLWKNHMHKKDVIELTRKFEFRLDENRNWDGTDIFKFVR